MILLYARTCWPLPYPMSVAHRKCKLNFNRSVLLIYVWTRWPHAVSHVHCVPQVNILFIPFKIIWIFIQKLWYFYTYGHVGHMPYPMSVTHRKCKFNFNSLALLIYAWTCWPHAVSHVHRAPQVNILFRPIGTYVRFSNIFVV